VNQLFSSACPVALSGSRLNTLADGDLPVYLLVHGSKDNWVRLKWLVDFATWMRQTADQDWGMIRWKMEEIGLGRSLLQGVLLAH
jgi:hypothetical protein